MTQVQHYQPNPPPPLAAATPFPLTAIPMHKPCLLYSALKKLEQQTLLTQLGQTAPVTRAALLPLVEYAIDQGKICTCQALVPTRGVQTFVDLATFQVEFDTFLQTWSPSGSPSRLETLHGLLAGSSRKPRSLKVRLRDLLEQNPIATRSYNQLTLWLLPLVERFCTAPEQYTRVAARMLFRPSQQLNEISQLLRLVADLQPRTVLEIGANRGGTIYLFARHAHPQARLMTVDLHLPNRRLLTSFARQQQRILLHEGDSTAPATIATIRQHFPAGVDFLFLDGDHSYEGIRRDFENYAPLAKPGGLIAFHDIVADNETRYGVITGGWSGGVPQFWQEIKSKYRYHEFIADPQQDGQGIGVLRV